MSVSVGQSVGKELSIYPPAQVGVQWGDEAMSVRRRVEHLPTWLSFSTQVF